MNCKPGDIARIVHPKAYGKLVSVLYAEPHGSFILPDGMPARKSSIGPGWVCKMLGAPIEAPTDVGTRLAMYGGIRDVWLRPIRPSEGQDETLTWKEVPHKERA